MRRLLSILSILIIMTFGSVAFAQVDIDGPSTGGPFSPIGGANAQAGATASSVNTFNPTNVNVNTDFNTNINSNTNRNTNVQGQNQGQRQGQGQLQGQDQKKEFLAK